MMQPTGHSWRRVPESVRHVYAQAKPPSVGGDPFFETRITAENVLRFISDFTAAGEATELLRKAGFRILGNSGMTINFSGPAKLFEAAFGENCRDAAKTGLIRTRGTAFAESLEGVALEERRVPAHRSATPETIIGPKRGYGHLDVPGDVSAGCHADLAHRMQVTGQDVGIMMIDTGFVRHPYFAARGYETRPVILGPGARNKAKDEVGHGTAQAAHLFAIAPGATLTVVKMNPANATGALDAAIGELPDVICCCWSKAEGAPTAADQVLAAAMARAIQEGMVVVVAHGNLAPDGVDDTVIFAGGAEITGFAGPAMLPVPPGSLLDRTSPAEPTLAAGDRTHPDDGWAVLSGTSATAAQIAGVCALMKQKFSGMSPKDVKGALLERARKITVADPDAAGGTRDQLLVDAHAAVRSATERFIESKRGGAAAETARAAAAETAPPVDDELSKLIPAVRPRGGDTRA